MWPWKKQQRTKDQTRKDLAALFLSETPYVPDRSNEIRTAIARNGRYEEIVEWRISTTTSLSVEPVQVKGKEWYRVSAKCDHEFSCHAPTIDRAAQFLRIYEQLIADMFYALGWPSWASKTKLHPEEGAA
jgi:hypothetical protein